MTRLLFGSDFHGQRAAYDELVAQAAAIRPDAVVLGGDLLPFPNLGEDPLDAQKNFVERGLRAIFTELKKLEVPVYAINGNDDWAAAVVDLEALAADGLVHWLHRTARPLSEAGDGWMIAGLGLVPVTPFYMKDFDRKDHEGWTPAIEPPMVKLTDRGPIRDGALEEIYARPTLEEELAELGDKSDPTKTVYVVHTPPADCQLDVIHGGQHVGSRSLRRFLEVERPPLSLHGHIHESPKLSGSIQDTIGQTLSINPGASIMGFRGALVDLQSRSVELVKS